MASTNKTSHYDLSQFLADDKPGWLTDVNSDMLKIDTGIFEAKTAADGASSSATTAMDAAQAAQTAATDAKTAAETASTNAAKATADAATALTTATNAQTTANTANTNATTAQTTATAAATAAANAQTTATNAETVANNALTASKLLLRGFGRSTAIVSVDGNMLVGNAIIGSLYFETFQALASGEVIMEYTVSGCTTPNATQSSRVVANNVAYVILFNWNASTKTLRIAATNPIPANLKFASVPFVLGGAV